MIQTEQNQIREFADKRSKRAEAILQKGSPETLDEFTYYLILPKIINVKKLDENHTIHGVVAS